MSACDQTWGSLQDAARQQQQQGESDAPVGLRGLQERQSCGQLLSASLEGLDNPG